MKEVEKCIIAGYNEKADLKVVLSQFKRKVVSGIWRMKLLLQAM